MALHDKLENMHWVTHTYASRCSCGWQSPTVYSESEADQYLQDHQKNDGGTHNG